MLKDLIEDVGVALLAGEQAQKPLTCQRQQGNFGDELDGRDEEQHKQVLRVRAILDSELTEFLQIVRVAV